MYQHGSAEQRRQMYIDAIDDWPESTVTSAKLAEVTGICSSQFRRDVLTYQGPSGKRGVGFDTDVMHKWLTTSSRWIDGRRKEV